MSHEWAQRSPFTNGVTFFFRSVWFKVMCYYVMLVQMIWNRVEVLSFCTVIQRYSSSELIFYNNTIQVSIGLIVDQLLSYFFFFIFLLGLVESNIFYIILVHIIWKREIVHVFWFSTVIQRYISSEDGKSMSNDKVIWGIGYNRANRPTGLIDSCESEASDIENVRLCFTFVSLIFVFQVCRWLAYSTLA